MSASPAMQGAEIPSVEVFLTTVLRSGLLTNEQVQAALTSVPPDRLKDARYLADHFVKVGKLSRFQAGKLLVGLTLGLVLGPYHVLAPIGKGGMGAVYLARDTRSQMLVAVKVLPPKRAKAEERLLARFKREMEICQRVAHPHLTRTYEVGVHENVNYIAMEYIPGRNLHKLVQEQGVLPVQRAARLFREIALGLEHAHSQGVIHRDLKPSNVVVTPDDHAKVLDLGLALMQGEVAGDRTVVGGQGYVVGTLDYLAPEQAEDAFNVDIRSDIYGLGCTLYYALTKSPPFPGGNALQKLLRHRCDEPAPITQLNPAVAENFIVVVRRMMAKRKEERYANAAEVRAALAPWAGAEPAAPATANPTPPAPEVLRDLLTGTAPAAANGVPWFADPSSSDPLGGLTARATPPPSDTSSVTRKPKPATGAAPPLVRKEVPAAESSSVSRKAKPATEPAPLEPPSVARKPKPTLPLEPPAPAARPQPLPEPVVPPPSPPPAATAPEPPPPAPVPEPPEAILVGPLPAEGMTPVAIVPLPEPAPVELAPVEPGLPFWLDYGLPVAVSALFLLIVWLGGLALLLRK